MLQVEGIAKTYDGRNILRDVSFTLEKSHVLIVTGRNGAGKTTLLNILAGLIPRDKGSAETDTAKLSDSSTWKEQTAYVSHELLIAENQSVEFTLEFYRKFFRIETERFAKISRAFDIDELKENIVGELSAGEARRLNLCLCFMRKVKLQIFDEPLVNLDVNYRKRFFCVLKNSLDHRITIIATHNPQAFVTLEPTFSIIKDGYLFQPDVGKPVNYQHILDVISHELAE
ncbi:MAG: ABC transporter ATP-binding protein [Planctomycetes bacterium]|nr:ABC transporter ATP-binding protein [Planctomycetota bacterium]